MNVQVNQAGTNNFPFDIESLDFFWRSGCGIFADSGNFSVNDKQIGDSVEAIGGVYNSPAGQKQRVHRGENNVRRLTRQAPAI
jgi:hypothetical protein